MRASADHALATAAAERPGRPRVGEHALDPGADRDLRGVQLGVRAIAAEPRPLALAGGQHAVPDGGRALAAFGERGEVRLFDR